LAPCVESETKRFSEEAASIRGDNEGTEQMSLVDLMPTSLDSRMTIEESIVMSIIGKSTTISMIALGLSLSVVSPTTAFGSTQLHL
jgi:hypothetical protein